MIHQHDSGRLASYMIGLLEPDQARSVETHLADCQRCRAELAELRVLDRTLNDMNAVPPEFQLEGPPEDGDLLLQRTLRGARQETAKTHRGKRFALVAAAVVAIIAAGAGGAMVSRQTDQLVAGAPVDASPVEPTPLPTSPPAPTTAGNSMAPPPASTVTVGSPPPPGVTAVPAPDSYQLFGANPATGSTILVTVKPAAGWVRLTATVGGIPAGEQCRLVAVSTDGSTQIAGSWLVSAAGEETGTTIDGAALVAPDRLTAVRVENFDGREFVKAST